MEKNWQNHKTVDRCFNCGRFTSKKNLVINQKFQGFLCDTCKTGLFEEVKNVQTTIIRKY